MCVNGDCRVEYEGEEERKEVQRGKKGLKNKVIESVRGKQLRGKRRQEKRRKGIKGKENN